MGLEVMLLSLCQPFKIQPVSAGVAWRFCQVCRIPPRTLAIQMRSCLCLLISGLCFVPESPSLSPCFTASQKLCWPWQTSLITNKVKVSRPWTCWSASMELSLSLTVGQVSYIVLLSRENLILPVLVMWAWFWFWFVWGNFIVFVLFCFGSNRAFLSY